MHSGRWVHGLAALCALPIFTIIFSLFWPIADVQLELFLSFPIDRYVLNSVLMVLGVGALSCTIGVAAAWSVTRYEFYGRKVLEWTLLLPLAMPAYILAMIYTQLLNDAGPVQQAIRDYWHVSYGDYMFPNIYSLEAVIAIMGLAFYPYVYVLARKAFIAQSVHYHHTSALLGVTEWQYFWRVALPMARPAVVIGVALACMEVLADFGTVSLLGVESFTTAIYRAWYGLGEPMIAAKLSAGLLVFVGALLWLERASRKDKRFDQAGRIAHTSIRRTLPLGRSIALALLCLLPPLFGFLLPAVVLVGLTDAQTLFHEDMLRALSYSLVIAFGVIVLLISIATLFACQLRFYPHDRLTRLCIRLGSLGYAIPGSVIAVGVFIPLLWLDKFILDIGQWVSGERGELLLTGSLFAVIIACAIRFLAIGLGALEAGFAKLSHHLDDAALLAGVTKAKLFQQVHVPLLRADYAFVAFIIFSEVIKELPASLLLRPLNVDTLAIRVYELAQDNHYSAAASFAFWIVAATVLAVACLARSQMSMKKETGEHDFAVS